MNEIEAVGVDGAQPQFSDAHSDEAGKPGRSERPWIFGFTIAPSAATANGVIQGGVLAYLLSLQHIGSGEQSRLIALASIPTWLYFAWSPITDFFIKRRSWLLLGGLLAGALMNLAFHAPKLTGNLSIWLLFLSVACSQLVVSACGGMMAALRSETAKGAASGFYQAGSLGFGALSASLLVAMSSRCSPGTLGWIANAVISLPALSALAAPEQTSFGDGSFGESLRKVGQEFVSSFLNWRAVPYLLCMLFPGGSGSAIGLLPGIAAQYHVSGDNVAWINGIGGTLMTAAGAVCVALVPKLLKKWGRFPGAPIFYMWVNLVNCLALAVLWLGSLAPSTYFVGTLAYLFTAGACYATFTMVILEFLGAAGKSGSTRYSIINSMGNVPVIYMLRVDGWGGDHFGARGLPGVECVVGAVGSVLLLSWLLTVGRERRVA